MAIIPTQALRHLQIQTTLGSDAFIPMQVQYNEALGQPFQAQVTLACHALDVDFDDILGTNTTIAIHNAATARKGAFGVTRYINGYFSSIAFQGHGAEGEALFQATVVPWLWFLTRTSDCRIFQNKTVPEILEEVFRDAGFPDFRKELHGDYKPREFCVQYRETDFQFVMRLMECEGIYYYFEHTDGSHVMVLCDDMVCHKKDDKHEVIRYIGGAEAIDRKGCIYEWSFSKQVKPGRVTLNDFNFKTPVPDPNLRLLSRSTAPHTQKPDTFEMYDSHGGYEDANEGNRYARIRMEQAIADRETAEATTDIIGLRAGAVFTLDRHPLASQNREYLCTKVEFTARESTYGSGSSDNGQFFSCHFTCIPSTCTFRPLRNTAIPRVEGPQSATVCGPKGDEIYVDDHARVKVQFHWDRYGRSDATSSCWIRVSQPWAGGTFGGLAIPRIGHEVIVDFIDGDPDRPIIVGRVYNGKNVPYPSDAGRGPNPARASREEMRERKKAKESKLK